MGKPVQVPDPVYDKISRIAERKDIPRGVVVRDWMDKAEKYEELESGAQKPLEEVQR